MSDVLVGINAHLLSRQASYRSAGIHGYLYNLLAHLPLVEAGPKLRYAVLVGEGHAPPAARLTVVRSGWPTGRPALRILWEQLALPWLIARGRLGAAGARFALLHSAGFVSPLIALCPTVVTVYDLSFIHYPTTLPAGRRLYLQLLAQLSCRRARRVIAISESTRRDLVKQWGLPAGKIDIAYPGVGEQFRPLPAGEIDAFRARRGLPERFILHLGTLQPRKNLVRLVQAFGRLQPRAGVKLVLAGGAGWFSDEISAEIDKLDLKDDVILPGYVTDEELPLWYNAASVLAYPSLYEGFGLPVVEAMACGTPVVASNVSSLPEAAGESAGWLVDPTSVAALTEALGRALDDPALREAMRSAGRQQAARFTWRATAAATVASYQRALETS